MSFKEPLLVTPTPSSMNLTTPALREASQPQPKSISSNQFVLPAWQQGLAGGISASIGSCITQPIDLVKTRSQLQADSQGLVHTVRSIYSNGGVLAFYRGLSASVSRQMLYSSARFALYDVLKSYNVNPMVAGLAAGACGSFLASPFDLALVRTQNSKVVPTPSLPSVLVEAYREGGLATLWRGSAANVTRGAVVTMCQLSTFERAKQLVADHVEKPLHPVLLAFIGASISGVCTALFASPFDVLKARAMNNKSDKVNVVSLAIHWTKQRGILGWWSGILPYYSRVAPQVTIMLVTWDAMQRQLIKAQS